MIKIIKIFFILTILVFFNCKKIDGSLFNNNKWNNVLDGEDKIIADKNIAFDGDVFKDKEVGYSIKIPKNVYLEYSHEVLISDVNITKGLNLKKYANKYFIHILKTDQRVDFGKDIYIKTIKKYEEKNKSNGNNVIIFNSKIVGEVDPLLNFAIQNPFSEIHFIKNGYWIAIYTGYFSLGNIEVKYPNLIEKSDKLNMVGQLEWKGGGDYIIKLIKDKSTEAPSELIKLYEYFNEVLNSLTFDDGKYEIRWKK